MVKDNSGLIGYADGLRAFCHGHVPTESSVYGRIFQYKLFNGSVRTAYQYDRTGRRTDILRPFE